MVLVYRDRPSCGGILPLLGKGFLFFLLIHITGGKPALWRGKAAPPPAVRRQSPCPPLRRRGAAPRPSGSEPEHRRGYGAPPAAGARGRESTGSLCSGPCRTGARVPPGVHRF